MVACFKLSCVVFWAGLFYFFSYMLGIEMFIGSFVPITEEIRSAESFIVGLCIFNICYCFIGCVFVKCDIVHTLYSLCYILPLLTMNIVGTILGMVSLAKAFESYPVITDPQLFQKTYLRPDSFISVERNGACCGYWGFWDHAGFLSSSKDANIFETNQLGPFLPKECCKVINRRGSCRSLLDVPPGKENNKTITMNLTEIIAWSGCPFPEDEKKVLLQTYEQFTGIFSLNPSVIRVCGCYEFMSKIHANVYGTVHYTFYLLNGLISFLMLSVYIRSWYAVRLHNAAQNALHRRGSSKAAVHFDTESSDGEESIISDVAHPSAVLNRL